MKKKRKNLHIAKQCELTDESTEGDLDKCSHGQNVSNGATSFDSLGGNGLAYIHKQQAGLKQIEDETGDGQ